MPSDLGMSLGHTPLLPFSYGQPLDLAGGGLGTSQKSPKGGKQDLGCPGKLTNHDATFDDQS